MKYTTFAAIRKGTFITVPIVALALVIRSCSSCGTEPQHMQSAQATEQVATSQQQSVAAFVKPQYGAQTLPLSEIEKEILQLQQAPLSSGKPDDNGSLKRSVLKGSIKLDIRCDQNKGFTTWNRIKVDWDNNKHYDEKWNFRQDGSVARFVAPSDDENYSMEYRLNGSEWKLK